MKEVEEILRDYDYQFKGTLLDDFHNEVKEGNLTELQYLDLLVTEWIPCWMEMDKESSFYLLSMQRKLSKILKKLKEE